ncbi:hypothetical protein AA309_22715 [Microvirga vignae]|uniref:DUF3427 domain-containing protein n=1 Tax=Microvirga vignae TaxID=1225564 RepID=A0A0H1R7H0_9HYPH|nr:DUF3427 domain-containing protein [Microvirga vignae]KLK90994.1 hypothetical protein AA309_22715 [Microvirga vignae]
MLHERFTVGEEYTRSDISEIVEYPIDSKYPTGIEVIPGPIGSPQGVILLVTLDKTTIQEDYDYYDYFFMGGKRFRWESQRRHGKDAPVLEILKTGSVESMLFCRVTQYAAPNVTRPHTYCGRVRWLNSFEEHPVKVDFTCLDYVASPQGSLAELYSWER